jgi:hypothetical protein
MSDRAEAKRAIKADMRDVLNCVAEELESQISIGASWLFDDEHEPYPPDRAQRRVRFLRSIIAGIEARAERMRP